MRERSFAQQVNTGPNACAFALNEAGGQGGSNLAAGGIGSGSIEVAYIDTIGAGLTKTVTLSYHGL
jgi:hypothetical protein